MTAHHTATATPEPVGIIDHAAWDRAYRKWVRDRALPAELEAMDRREEQTKARAKRANKGRGR